MNSSQLALIQAQLPAIFQAPPLVPNFAAMRSLIDQINPVHVQQMLNFIGQRGQIPFMGGPASFSCPSPSVATPPTMEMFLRNGLQVLPITILTPSPSLSPAGSTTSMISPINKKQTSNNSVSDEFVDVVSMFEVNCKWGDCYETFTTHEELVKHVRSHIIRERNKNDWQCEWRDCDRHFSFKALHLLHTHLRQHTQEKPFVCHFPGCQKAYGRGENLKTHMRTHTGEKPYPCVECGKTFTNASDRAKHQTRTHSSEKPYGCPELTCQRRYTDPSSLRKHMLTRHGIERYGVLKQARAELNKHTRWLSAVHGLPHPKSRFDIPFSENMLCAVYANQCKQLPEKKAIASPTNL